MCIHFKKKKKTICKQPQFLVKKKVECRNMGRNCLQILSSLYGTGNQSQSILYKLAEKIPHIPICVGGWVCVCCKKNPENMPDVKIKQNCLLEFEQNYPWILSQSMKISR